MRTRSQNKFRAALAKYIPEAPQNSHIAQKYANPSDGEIVSKITDIPQSALNQTVNKVCKICNEGWLNNMVEIPVEPLLAKLIKGESVQLSINDMNTLALWAAKTAAVRALADPKPIAIPVEHYEYIMHNLRPPAGTYIWLCSIDSAVNTFTRHTRARISNMEDILVGRFHQTTIILGHAAFFVLGVSNPSLAYPLMHDAILFMDSSGAIRLTPDSEPTIWPPNQISLMSAKTWSDLSIFLNADLYDQHLLTF